MFPKDAEIEAKVTAAIIVMYTNPKLREPRVKCSFNTPGRELKAQNEEEWGRPPPLKSLQLAKAESNE